MSAGDVPDDLTPAERRLTEYLELLRTGAPESPPFLVSRVIRGVRWQRAVREPLVLVGTVAVAMAESLGLLFTPSGGGS